MLGLGLILAQLPPKGLRASDIHTPGLHINKIKVRNRDFTVGIFVNLAEDLVVAKVIPFTEIPGHDASMPDLGPTVGQVRFKLADVIGAFPGLSVYGFLGTEIIEIDAARLYS